MPDKGIIRTTIRALLGACLLALSMPLMAQDLRGIAELAQGGAPGLALKLLDQVQPKAEENLDGWLFFERQRIDILRDWQQWQALTDRLERLPENAPADFKLWAQSEQVDAYLQAGRGESARGLLRGLIWQASPPATGWQEQLALYRRLVIRSYLVEKNLDDAQRAMRRYQQDYGTKDLEWRRLQARVLLSLNRAAEARSLLQDITEPDAELLALRLLAELRSQSRPATLILGDVRKAVENTKLQPVEIVRLWSVGAEAAQEVRGRLTETRILETVLTSAARLPDDDLFSIGGDRLWDAYRKYGREEGNALQLLIGQDQRWLDEAAKWLKSRPEKARALLAVVMLNGSDAQARRRATDAFVQSIRQLPESSHLLQKLFVGTKLFPVEADIPDSVRYLLVDDALTANDIALATRLMSGFEAVPAGSAAFEWGLRRARVLVLGGKHEEGVEVLNKLMQNQPRLERADWDRVLQVIFDLQTVGRHADAITLFKTVLQRPLEPQMQREILYWQADSYKAAGDVARAAWLYLKSATLLDAQGLDPWGQTARFQAAEVLAMAGLVDDARRIYEALLNATPEPGRRAMIKYKLQELWLKQPQPSP
jgi:hypothetical protein